MSCTKGIYLKYYFDTKEPAFSIESGKFSDEITDAIDSAFTIVNQMITSISTEQEELDQTTFICNVTFSCPFNNNINIYSFEGTYDRTVERENNETVVVAKVKLYENDLIEEKYDSLNRLIEEKWTKLKTRHEPIQKRIYSYRTENGRLNRIILNYSDLDLVNKTIEILDDRDNVIETRAVDRSTGKTSKTSQKKFTNNVLTESVVYYSPRECSNKCVISLTHSFLGVSLRGFAWRP